MDWNEYADLYADIRVNVADKEVALAILAETSKDRRQAEISGRKNPDEATESQLDYLKDLGVDVKTGLSKAEASKLIDEAKERRGH
ncbi:hypothetical protein ACFL2T_00775 [Elusimicrobiota bacterium]